jgi:hypothetical protein
MSHARYTTAPASEAARAVASVESESMTTSSSTKGASVTRAFSSGPTTVATVRSSFLAGITTLIRVRSRCFKLQQLLKRPILPA